MPITENRKGITNGHILKRLDDGFIGFLTARSDLQDKLVQVCHHVPVRLTIRDLFTARTHLVTKRFQAYCDCWAQQ
jgi:hypothetical protein